jgi:hypothetical protein
MLPRPRIREKSGTHSPKNTTIFCTKAAIEQDYVIYSSKRCTVALMRLETHLTRNCTIETKQWQVKSPNLPSFPIPTS